MLLKKLSKLTVLFFLTIPLCSQAQQYISVNFGYGMGILENDLLDGEISLEPDSEFLSLGRANYSYGEGLSVSLAYDRHFNATLYGTASLRYKFLDVITYQQSFQSSSTDVEHTGRMFSSGLRIGAITKLSEKADFFIEAGPVLGLVNEFSVAKKTVNSSENIERSEKYFNGIALGGDVRIGLKRSINKNIRLSCELSASFIDFAPNKGETIIYTVDGENQIENLTVSERNYIYSNRIENFPVNGQEPQNLPSRKLKRNYSFSRLAFEIGVDILLKGE